MKHFSPFHCDKKWILKPTQVSFVQKGRTFLHVDLDAFFASVEQIKNPRLRGRPVIVGGHSSQRGVVTAASYEAKRLGVTTGMPWMQAKAKCPQAVFLPADFDSYTSYSRLVRNILEKLAPVVAPASVDECYLDLTGCERLYGSVWDAANRVREEILRRTGLSVSVGIGASHSVAKMASKLAKPAGILFIPAGSEQKFLSHFPVEAMPGIGPHLGEALCGMGILTLGQLAALPASLLQQKFGAYGPLLLAKARGEDRWALEITEVVKSIGKQKTLEEDTSDLSLLRQELWGLVEIVGQELRRKHFCARTIRVQVRYADFSGDATSITLKDPTAFDRTLFRYAEELLLSLRGVLTTKQSRDCFPSLAVTKIRLIGFTAAELVSRPSQFDLFRHPKQQRWEKFYGSLDWLREKFGFETMQLKH